MWTKMGLRLKFPCCSFVGQNLANFSGILLSGLVTRNSEEHLSACTIAHVSLTSAGSLTTQFFVAHVAFVGQQTIFLEDAKCYFASVVSVLVLVIEILQQATDTLVTQIPAT